MTFDLITALIGFAFVSSITPGPNNLMLLASGANFGLKRTLPHMFGVSIGHSFMVAMVGLGLMQIFNTFPVAYTILKVASVGYLLYLAYRIATNTTPPQSHEAKSGTPFSFLQAAAFQWVNPKGWTMALTAISVYTPPNPDFYDILTVAGIFALTNLPSITTWVLMGREMSRFLNTPKRLRMFNLTAATLLVASLIPIFLQTP